MNFDIICDALRDLVPFIQFKKLKNTHVGPLFLVKLQAEACNFTESNTPPWVFLLQRFSRFLNCTNGTKSRNAPLLCPKYSPITEFCGSLKKKMLSLIRL